MDDLNNKINPAPDAEVDRSPSDNGPSESAPSPREMTPEEREQSEQRDERRQEESIEAVLSALHRAQEANRRASNNAARPPQRPAQRPAQNTQHNAPVRHTAVAGQSPAPRAIPPRQQVGADNPPRRIPQQTPRDEAATRVYPVVGHHIPPSAGGATLPRAPQTPQKAPVRAEYHRAEPPANQAAPRPAQPAQRPVNIPPKTNEPAHPLPSRVAPAPVPRTRQVMPGAEAKTAAPVRRQITPAAPVPEKLPPRRKVVKPPKKQRTPRRNDEPVVRDLVTDDGKGRRGGVNSLLKAVIYIVCVLVISGVLSYIGIAVGNDCFALVKSDEEIEITIGDGTTTAALSDILNEKKIIHYPWAFNLYAWLRNDSYPYVAGTYTVSPSMNYDELRHKFQNLTNARTTLEITIPEGYTVDQIIDVMVENGIGTREGFVDVIQNYDYDFWFLDELVQNPDRKYRLEGYLYPDTYQFYSDTTPATVIYKLLVRFDELFTDKLRERCTTLGWSVDDAVNLASIVQMEAKYEAEYGAIASVFVNRLHNPRYETYGLLNSDATIQYALGVRKNELTNEDTKVDNPYNTYLHAGLPPGPISNPTQTAISYALWPATTNFYYFISGDDGWSLFATTHDEHLANILKVRGTE